MRHKLCDGRLLLPVRVGKCSTVWTRALIDTGASCSCVRSTLIETIGARPIEDYDRKIVTVNGGEFVSKSYAVEVGFKLEGRRHLQSDLLIVSSLGPGSFFNDVDLILGRDFLSDKMLHYDGPGGTFSIEPVKPSDPRSWESSKASFVERYAVD